MGAYWGSLGFTRWPMSLCVVVMLLIGFWSALRLFQPDASADLRTKAWIDAVLICGVSPAAGPAASADAARLEQTGVAWLSDALRGALIQAPSSPWDRAPS